MSGSSTAYWPGYDLPWDVTAGTGRPVTDPSAPAPGRTIPVAPGGVDLFRIALAAYGDALMWHAVAAANGLWDPWPETTPETLYIPRLDSTATDAGGVLGAP